MLPQISRQVYSYTSELFAARVSLGRNLTSYPLFVNVKLRSEANTRLNSSGARATILLTP